MRRKRALRGELNVYAFSLQNSLRYMDPDGLDAGFWSSTKHQAWFQHAMHNGGDLGDATSGGAPMMDTPQVLTRKEKAEMAAAVVTVYNPIFLGGHWEENRKNILKRYGIDMGNDPTDWMAEWVWSKVLFLPKLFLDTLDEGHEACSTLNCAKPTKPDEYDVLSKNAGNLGGSRASGT